MEFRLHPARERDYEELKQERDWDITKVAAGEDFIIMPPYASPPMASSLRKEVVFPPLYKPIDWRYAPRNFRPSSNPAASRARAERHNPCSIATIAFSSPGIFSSDSLAAPFAVHGAANYLYQSSASANFTGNNRNRELVRHVDVLRAFP